MKVVILCGGQGTRLREETEFRPKPLVEIGGRPILWHIMKIYAHHGFNEFVLCLGYKGDMIKHYFVNYDLYTRDFDLRLGEPASLRFLSGHREESWRVTLADTGLDSMTGARVKRIRRYVDGTFMVTYGDGLGNIDVPRLLAFHRSHGKIGTVTAVRPPSRFGELVLEREVVREFNEKPQATGGLINGGFFVFEPAIFDFLGDDPKVALEQEPLMSLARAGQLCAFEHEGFWQPMDTYREHQLLNDLWRSERPPWKVWE